MLRTIAIIINFMLVISIFILIKEKGFPNSNDKIIAWVFILSLISCSVTNLYYMLFYSVKEDDNLLSLWLRVKKKELRNKLKD